MPLPPRRQPRAPLAQPANPPHRARIASTRRAPPAAIPKRGRRSRSDLLALKSPQPPGRPHGSCSRSLNLHRAAAPGFRRTIRVKWSSKLLGFWLAQAHKVETTEHGMYHITSKGGFGSPQLWVYMNSSSLVSSSGKI
ncbi:hypothetical protein BS78_04G297700 [Paspalum vaginatum]|nr:hypothetical protein BS78_04G297700 [Paspalum vaginatum]